MALLAITRLTQLGPVDGELATVAQLTGQSAYETRLRLMSAPPIVLARSLPLERAQHWLAVLRERGHGAVAVDEPMLPRDERIRCPQDIELHERAFVGVQHGRRFELPLASVMALVRAVEVIEEARMRETSEKKLAIGRALLTGGLMRSKEVTSTQTDVRTEAERTLYVFLREGPDPMVLRERVLRYAGLGPLLARTEHECFDRLAGWFRSQAPHAIYDERLATRKRRPTLQGLHGTSKDQVAISSNASETALAACLLVHAHLQRQL
jgi:hypothetical protein